MKGKEHFNQLFHAFLIIFETLQAVADLRGAPPMAQNFLNFMQFFGKV